MRPSTRGPWVGVGLLALLPLLAGACRRGEAQTREGPPQPAPPPGPSASTSTGTAEFTATADGSTDASDGAPREVRIDLTLAGDAIPQVKVLANDVARIVEGLPSSWGAADARVFNLEAPVGGRKDLPGDKSLLAFASPPAWVEGLVRSTRASALVVANNHSCDLGAEGLTATVSAAAAHGLPAAGASSDDPWAPVDVVDVGGRRVCLVAWTTFVNDSKGGRQRACIAGASGTHLALAELGPRGLDTIHAALSRPGRWDGCDARVAYLHGGREYKPQIAPVLEQAEVAAAYVDAVVITHPHVPDLVDAIAAPAPRAPEAAGGRTPGRAVPVYRSLGNFVTNQGIAWTPGMSVDLLTRDDVPDPIRTVWTRVSVLARLRFAWSAAAPPHAPPTSLRWGYGLLFSERSGEGSLQIRLRPLPNAPDDPIATKLRRAPKPFGELLDGKCRIDPDDAPTCGE